MNEELSLKLQALIQPLVAEAQVDLVHLSLCQRGRQYAVTLLVDLPTGGIGLDQCATLNRRLVTQLEKTGLLGEDLTVDVSSPGLDWPLTTRKDFLRALSREMRIYLTESLAGKWEHLGELIAVKEQSIILQKETLGKKENLEIPFEKIKKGIQIV